jgi:DNA-binding transcriptional MocR family regulator
MTVQDWERLYASRMSRVVASDIRERMKLLGRPGIIHLGGGLPDPAFFPRAAIADAAARVLGEAGSARTALQYAASEGHRPLKDWLAGYMGSLGVACGPDNILITNGSQQALDFVGRLFLSPGDGMLVERPTFIGALRAFDAYEARYGWLPASPADRPAMAAGRGAKLGYAGPDFRNPTGTCMTRPEREALLDAAAELGIALLEDGCYEKLRYEGSDVPSLLALEAQRTGGIDQGRVIYTGTFSKTVVPSLRVGWIVGPAPVIRKLVLIKQASDLATSALNQMIMLEVVKDGLDGLVRQARGIYGARRDSMLQALADHMPAGVSWTRPEGGLYVWLTLPPGMDGGLAAERALAEADVSVVGGASFYPIESDRNTMRLSFSLASEEDAREGIRRLGALLARMAVGQ